MKIKDFIEDFKSKKIQNTKVNPNAVSDYIKKELEIKEYIPFRKKREIAEMVVANNTSHIDGIKKNDAINQYISFVVAMLSAHTNLEFGQDPVEDYDMLAESHLLPLVIAEFKESYDECDIILKMALAAELEDNNINVAVARFLNDLSEKLDGINEIIKDKLIDFNIEDVFGDNFKQEDLAKLSGFLNRFK